MRFVSLDSVEYKDYNALGGLNLWIYCNNNPIMFVDPDGNFALISFGIAAIIGLTLSATLIGGTLQLVSNAMSGFTGSDLWRGVVGAAFGSGVNALALCLFVQTGGGSLFIAAGLSAVVQTGVDILEKSIRGEKIGWYILRDLAVNFGGTLIGNYIGVKLIYTNNNWFKPQKFISIFTKSYGQKIIVQSIIGSFVSGAINYIRNKEEYSFFDLLFGE